MRMYYCAILILVSTIASIHSTQAQSISTVEGVVSFFDSRIHRSSWRGSRLRDEGFRQNLDFVGARIFLVQQNGTCIDHAFDCGERDDEDIGVTTSLKKGLFRFTKISRSAPVYLRSDLCLGTNDGQHAFACVLGDLGEPLTAFSYPAVKLTRPTHTINLNLSCPQLSGEPCLDSTAIFQQYTSILATIQDARTFVGDFYFDEFGPEFGLIKAYYPRGPEGQCEDHHGGSTFGFGEFCMGEGHGNSNHVVAHELGHIYHLRLIENDIASGIDFYKDGEDGPLWSWDSDEYEKAATNEGWAEFFATVVHWKPDSDRPHKINAWQLMEGGNCIHESDGPSGRPGNVARFFWDLYDSTAVDDRIPFDASYADESISLPIAEILDVWRDFSRTFPERFCDRGAIEEGRDGRNVWDYVANASGREWFLKAYFNVYRNCLNLQRYSWPDDSCGQE